MLRYSHGAPRAIWSRERGRLAAASLTTGVLIALTALVSGAAASGPAHTTVILGQTGATPNPSCPGLPCQAIGSVTGFQLNNGQTNLPFNIRREGKITDWTLTLAQPTPKQRAFFNGFFGTPPEARLAILKRVTGTNPPRFSLISQGAIRVLSPYLGQTVKFTANLKVQKGDIVGLTVPTWAPAFAEGLPANNVWRASRLPEKCTNPTDVRQGQPQTKIGRRATYGCRYSTARLLYTATLSEEG
jgi:hypothetical protein